MLSDSRGADAQVKDARKYDHVIWEKGLPPVWFSWSRFLNLAFPTISEPGAWLPHWRSFCCSEPILWEFNSSVLMLKLSFVPMNLHSCWPRDWKGSIGGVLECSFPRSKPLALISNLGNTAFLFYPSDWNNYNRKFIWGTFNHFSLGSSL